MKFVSPGPSQRTSSLFSGKQGVSSQKAPERLGSGAAWNRTWARSSRPESRPGSTPHRGVPPGVCPPAERSSWADLLGPRLQLRVPRREQRMNATRGSSNGRKRTSHAHQTRASVRGTFSFLRRRRWHLVKFSLFISDNCVPLCSRRPRQDLSPVTAGQGPVPPEGQSRAGSEPGGRSTCGCALQRRGFG